jgi:hypothetical protein
MFEREDEVLKSRVAGMSFFRKFLRALNSPAAAEGDMWEQSPWLIG